MLGLTSPGKAVLYSGPKIKVEILHHWQKQAQKPLPTTSWQAIQEGGCGVWTRSTAVRGLVGRGRWSYCLSSHAVEKSQKLALGKGLQKRMGVGEAPRGWKQRLSQMVSPYILNSQTESDLPLLVLAFSDTGISDFCVQISGSPWPSREKHSIFIFSYLRKVFPSHQRTLLGHHSSTIIPSLLLKSFCIILARLLHLYC